MNRGLGQRRACWLMNVSRSMVTYSHRQPVKDKPIRALIDSVVAQHPSWGKRLIFGWIRELGHAYTECSVFRIYRQAGYAAQWRKRTRKIKRNQRINPIAARVHDVWCMGFAEDRLMNGRKLMALLVKDEATSFGLSLAVRRSFKAVDVERELDQLVAKHGTPHYIRSDNGGQFIAYVVKRWAHKRNVTLAYIDPGSLGRMDSQKALSAPIVEKFSTPKSFSHLKRHTSFQIRGYTCTTRNDHTANTITDHHRQHSPTRQLNN